MAPTTTHTNRGVVLHPPKDRDSGWVAETPDGRLIRVGADAARLLRHLDRSDDPVELAKGLGPPWTAARAQQAVRSLAEAGLIVPPGPVPRPRRMSYCPPASLQFTIVTSTDWLARRHHLLRRVVRAPTAAALLVMALGGLVGLGAHAHQLADDLRTSGHGMGIVAIAMAVMLFNSLHELAHGAALAAYGGRVRRFGVMVMYGAPALFCDVTDAWRLPSRQRCAVALAGVLASLGLAGTAATAYALVPGLRVPAVGTIAVLTYCSAVLNIVPFVKFDGYLALMARVDIPHLRAKAMHDWRDLVVSTLVGAPRHPQLPSLRWAPAFGFACCVTPVLLVGLAVTGLLHAAALLGVPGLVVLPVVAGAPLALVASRLPTWSATVRAVRSRDLGPASERRT